MTKQVYWFSAIPKTCDTCDTPITDIFYDAVTVHRGKWAHMCPSCFHLGPGFGVLGPGKGQEYKKQPDGRFLKTAG